MSSASEPQLRVIQRSRGLPALGLAALWRHRELLYFLAWRDLKVRYRQATLGVMWALIQPLSTMLVYTLFFGIFARLPSEGVPYPLFALAGILPWTFFAKTVERIASSLVLSQSLITKVYFPRLVLPLANTLPGLLDLLVGSVALIGLLVYYRFVPTPRLLWLPGYVALALAAALAVGLWLAALHVRHRDVRYLTPTLLQVWMFCSPVIYSSRLVPPEHRGWYAINPMMGVIEGFRWVFLGTEPTGTGPAPVALGLVALLLVSGLIHFRLLERSFADVI